MLKTFLNGRIAAAVVVVLAVVAAFYMWQPIVSAQWDIIDDHEVMGFIGTGQRLSPLDIPAVLRRTELRSDSRLPRFRPAYYGLKALESVLWGKGPTLWFGFRLCLAVALAAVLADFCVRAAGAGVTLLALPLMLMSTYWVDFITRLGTGETYGVLGLLLILVGSRGLVVQKESRTTTLSLTAAGSIALGVVVMTGSKENCLFVALYPAWLIFSRRISSSWLSKATLFGSIAFTLWVALVVFDRLQATGRDVYMQDVSPESSLQLLRALITVPAYFPDWGLDLVGRVDAARQLLARNHLVMFVGFWGWVSSLAGLGVLSYLQRACDDNGGEGHRAGMGVAMGFSATLLAAFLFQYVFYAGQWPNVTPMQERYLFPGVIAAQLAMLGTLGLAISKANRTVASRSVAAVTVVACVATFVVVTLPSGISLDLAFKANRISSWKVVRKTTDLQRRLALVVDNLRLRPDLPVIIQANHVLDYEPAHSLRTFLRSYGLDNPIAVRIYGYSSSQFPPRTLLHFLAAGIEKTMANGDPDGFVPLSAVDDRNCFSIGLDGPYAYSCLGGIVIWPSYLPPEYQPITAKE